MFRIIISQDAVLTPRLRRKRGMIIERDRGYSIPEGATHIGVKLGILRFLHPQNHMLEIPEGFFGPSGSHWRYWSIPKGVQKVSFPFFVIPPRDTWCFGPKPFIYGEPQFNQ